jgi:CSLREA domain-containing protein
MALALPATAGAETFTVDSAVDEPDLLAGVGGCLTGAGKCTLRAAIEEANTDTEGGDEITFDGTVFDGDVSSTIILGDGLPAIVKPTRISGGECLTESGATGPCVAIQGTNSAAALSVEADEVTLQGLDIIGSNIGIAFADAHEFELLGNWFGIGLDGSTLDKRNGTSVFVGPGSGNGLVGGDQPGEGNLFVAGIGLEIRGASQVEVLGNHFGVRPEGTTGAADGLGSEIVVASDTVEGLDAIGNTIGTTVSEAAAATPACDGGCNLISGGGDGINLLGIGLNQSPPVRTTIAGNHFGLNAAGTAAIPNVRAIAARGSETTIGGPAPGDANRINGGGDAITAVGPDLVVEGNLIGVNADASEVFAPPIDGISVYSEGLSSAADEAVIAENVIGVNEGSGISQEGLGATIAGNVVAGAEIGIHASGSSKGHGNLIAENLVEGSETVGIMVENDLNEIYGNEVFESGLDGIMVVGRTGPPGTSGNVVGGATAADENVISFNGRWAIVIANAEGSQNEIGRNRGTGNEDRFIALFPYLQGESPNGGIEPPVISSAGVDGAGGEAEPGALVRVFRKESEEPGEIASFLGEAIADIDGKWSLEYGALPGGTPIAATQTNETGGTSELDITTVPGGPAGDGPSGIILRPPRLSVPHASVESPPQTKIVKGPKRKSRRRNARFEFRSEPVGAAFQCRMDGRRFRPCASPVRYRRVVPGHHVFEVRAVTSTGGVDATPATRGFTVIAERRGARRD